MTTKRKPKSRRPTTPRKVLVRWVNVYGDEDFSLPGATFAGSKEDARSGRCDSHMDLTYWQTVRIEIPVEGV